ncbi:MAG: hypothetical protein ABIN18_10060, partial [Pseudomonadota bacterium]
LNHQSISTEKSRIASRMDRSVVSAKMIVFVRCVPSTPPPHSTEICEMSGLVLLKGETFCKNVRISLWF